MYALRQWSANHSMLLRNMYVKLENVLLKLHPVFQWLGYRRVDKIFLGVEKLAKGLLFDSQSCGQCIIDATGMVCPMNCPKQLRNGPCGGVRANGYCEVNPELYCVWVLAWEGNKRLGVEDYPIQVLQPPVDNRLRNTSAWLREVRRRTKTSELTG